jgi:hypothetical protein
VEGVAVLGVVRKVTIGFAFLILACGVVVGLTNPKSSASGQSVVSPDFGR